MFLFLIPVLGLGLGMAGERASLLQAAGVLTILLGLLAVIREKARVPRTVE
ncbi:MAG: hypothetical protein WEE89_13210 [Gemmatimonadota bacterium]